MRRRRSRTAAFRACLPRIAVARERATYGERLMPRPLTDTATLLALLSLDGIGPAGALRIARGERPAPPAAAELAAGARERIDACALEGVHVIGYFEERFPQRLREIPSPPAVLYVRGEIEALHAPRALAVVGTRNPSRFGATAADTLTRAAASTGAVIVSGLAAGVDALAHEAALAEGAPTVALLGGGVDAPTPAANRGLAERILAAGGALVSEQPLGTPPTPQTLVARNRLQSGLAACVLVAQTAERGGTVYTARFAAQQGRPVFCPSPIGDHPASAGLRVLLEVPAVELPDRLVAFKGARKLCDGLPAGPLARPLTRQTIGELLAALDA